MAKYSRIVLAGALCLLASPASAQLVASDRILGRDTAGVGQIEQLTVGGALSFTGSKGITATGANILTQLLTVDGSGSGLDADLLDGHDSAFFQTADPELSCLAGLASAADKAPYFTGSGTCSLFDLSSAERTYLTTSSLANLASVLTNEASGWATFNATPSMANLGSFLTDDAAGWTTFGTTPTIANLATLLTDEAAGWANWQTTPSSANLATYMTDEAFTLSDGELGAIAGLVSAADKGIYFTGSGTASLFDLSSSMRTWHTTQSVANLASVLSDEAAGWANWQTTPTSANLATYMTDEAFVLSDGELGAIAGLTSAANKCIEFTGSGTASAVDCTATGLSFMALSAGTSGGVPYFSAANTVSSTGALTQFAPLYGGGAGVGPTAMAAGTNGQVIVGQTAGAPLWKTISGDLTAAASGAFSIGADKITEAMLKAVDSASDEECLTYESTVGDFEWQACGVSTFLALTDTPSSYAGSALKFLRVNATEDALEFATPAGAGTVTGPITSTDNAITRWDGATGTIIQNSNWLIDDSGNLTAGSGSGIAWTVDAGATDPVITFGSGTVAATAAQWTITNTGTAFNAVNDTDNASVHVARFRGARATPADSDEAFVTFNLNNDAPTSTEFGRLTWEALDVNAGTSVDGQLRFAVATAGTVASEVDLNGTSFYPHADGGNSLGTTANGWQNLFANTGFVFNWENGDCLLTHSSNSLALTGSCVLTSDSTLDLSGVTTATLSASGADLLVESKIVKHVGEQTIALLAGAGTTPSGGGIAACTPVAAFDSGSNDVFMRQCSFAAAADNAIYWYVPFPKSANVAVDLQARVDWTSATTTDTTDNVIWTMACVAFSNDDAINGNAFPAVDTVTDTQTASGDFLSSARITAITPAGTWAAGDGLVCRLTRDADAAGDNFNGTADLLGVQLYFQDNAANDD